MSNAFSVTKPQNKFREALSFYAYCIYLSFDIWLIYSRFYSCLKT